MPQRTKKLEGRVKEGAIALIKKYLDVRVEPDEIGVAHYRCETYLERTLSYPLDGYHKHYLSKLMLPYQTTGRQQVDDPEVHVLR